MINRTGMTPVEHQLSCGQVFSGVFASVFDPPSVVVVALRTMAAQVPIWLVNQTAVAVSTKAVVKKGVIPAVGALAVLAEAGQDPALSHQPAGRKVPRDAGLAEVLVRWGGILGFGANSRGKETQESGQEEDDGPHRASVTAPSDDTDQGSLTR